MTARIETKPEQVEPQPPAIVPGVEFSRSHLGLPEGLSLEAWQEIGGRLRSVERSVMWWIGDWLRFGETRYGQYEQIAADTGYSTQHLRDAKYVAGAYEVSDRSDDLPWSYYKATAGLPVLERREVLGVATAEGWTRRLLIEELQRRKSGEPAPKYVAPESPFGYALRSLSRLVAAVFDLEPAAFTSEGKGSPHQVHARQVLFYLLHTECEFDQAEIAAALGRHRSTVGHAITEITGLREEPEIDAAFTWLGEMYRQLRDARDRVPQLIEALAP